MMYRMFFQGHDFVSGLRCTLKTKKNLLKILKNRKAKNFFPPKKRTLFFSIPGYICRCVLI